MSDQNGNAGVFLAAIRLWSDGTLSRKFGMLSTGLIQGITIATRSEKPLLALLAILGLAIPVFTT